MMKLAFLPLLLILIASAVAAQAPTAPRKMQFANINLTIHEEARREIQETVNQLTRNAQYFEVKAERARAYFPIVEEIFKEENLPDDFKYLVIQESALVADAVSASGAVGYWQFKDFTAEEVGMRVDAKVDERMNIVSSTRGAARYLKQNNFYFNNWICALQAYQMGAGAVRRSIGERYNGARHMDINSKTYWYVKKYLAHKIAFEGAVQAAPKQPLSIYENQSETSLKKLAHQLSVDLDRLEQYNKWAKSGSIPGDRKYAVLVPANAALPGVALAKKQNLLSASRDAKKPPVAATATVKVDANHPIAVNGVSVVWAGSGESLAVLAKRAGLALSSFLKYNDIDKKHRPTPNQPYFSAAKKKRSTARNYQMAAGETLWEASQHCGIKLRQLERYNSLSARNVLQPNTLLSLRAPKSGEKLPWVSKKNRPVVELDENSLFDWGDEGRKEESGR